MTGDAVNGARNGSGARSGARTLNLLAAPLNARILRALRDGPKQQAELRREAGHPAQTTLRAQLKRLVEAGAVLKRRRNRFPGVLEYELSAAGADLLAAAEALERWLEGAPGGPLELGGPAAKAAVKALTEGWSTTMLRALAAKPLTLTELDRAIPTFNYPSLERRFGAMRLAGLIEPHDADGRGTPHGLTAWARQGVAPILLAARWECRHAPREGPHADRLDAETALLLAAAQLRLPDDASGACRVAVELRGGEHPRLAGALIEVKGGRVASRTTRLEGDPAAWGTGPPGAWLAAVIDRDPSGLELGGDGSLARLVIEGLHSALFALPIPD